MKTNFTPGPWQVAEGPKTTVFAEGGLWFVADCDAKGGGPARTEMCKANARLIAAAPELLATLEAIIEEAGPLAGLDDGPGTINRIARVARAAIAKATGEQP